MIGARIIAGLNEAVESDLREHIRDLYRQIMDVMNENTALRAENANLKRAKAAELQSEEPEQSDAAEVFEQWACTKGYRNFTKSDGVYLEPMLETYWIAFLAGLRVPNVGPEPEFVTQYARTRGESGS